MLQSDAKDVFLNYALAMAMLSEGDDDAGIAQLQHVIDLDGDYVAAHFQRGQALARAGRTNEAREALRRGILVARRVPDAHAEGEMTAFLEALETAT
jgi:predicted RNA polymerase sigma factor